MRRPFWGWKWPERDWIRCFDIGMMGVFGVEYRLYIKHNFSICWCGGRVPNEIVINYEPAGHHKDMGTTYLQSVFLTFSIVLWSDARCDEEYEIHMHLWWMQTKY